MRQCSRSGCQRSAVATLTYVYADSTVVLGPLATYAEPHSYDLCALHAERLTAPRGWEVLRLAMPDGPPPPNPDDLLALADAVREAAAEPPEQPSGPGTAQRTTPPPLESPTERGDGPSHATRRGHLRILRD
ncbi:hypothetical protein FHU41_002801 [Psychromicrobium silvestre]|uniref:DUF3499 domain-containing protein n=2 Tax=Psychromicrobium silvestre TaxID=1645614 RepID=A0A7Y9LVX6_9MICC|nr:DUF3499 domain-containing protein [Psychromicrobium silvestre]NYE96551.1 hypothetical protein [Psychromicrobium silvestre]